ncbi:K(+)-transporting ATPase subunit F [Deinococcus sp. KSM4-11]|nr:K(+)-transporting ATPase subunit F [Deinococcus sp. KSM4-11]
MHGHPAHPADPRLLRPDRARRERHGTPVILFLALVSLLIGAYLVYSLLRPEDF